MGLFGKAFTDLSENVKCLEERTKSDNEKEIKEIIEAQRVIDEILVANSDAIKKLNSELAKVQDETKMVEKKVVEKKGVEKKVVEKKVVEKKVVEKEVVEKKVIENKRKKCRYFDRGYCKYTTKCRFIHPVQNCILYMEGMKCDRKTCEMRHPKVCKWMESKFGCTREDCNYIHVTLACNDENSTPAGVDKLKCVSCKTSWEIREHVVEHMILNRQAIFCLNCDEWVKDKSRVFKEGWSILDVAGNLRYDV